MIFPRSPFHNTSTTFPCASPWSSARSAQSAVAKGQVSTAQSRSGDPKQSKMIQNQKVPWGKHTKRCGKLMKTAGLTPKLVGLSYLENGDKEASLAWSPHILSQESPLVRALIACHGTTTGTRSYITIQWICIYIYHFTRSHRLLTVYLVYDTLYIHIIIQSIHTYTSYIYTYTHIHVYSV